MDLDFHARFKSAISEMEKYGESYAEARAKSYYAQEMKSSIVASLMKDMGDIPVSKAEIQAKASEDYKKHLQETAAAIKLEHQLKSKLEVAKAKFEGNRSLSSLEKATRNLTDGS